MNKQEKFAWARMGVMLLVIVYLVWHLVINEVELDQKQKDVREFIRISAITSKA
jgi:uncharacterized membrane protein YjfL (UPF0719 family)